MTTLTNDQITAGAAVLCDHGQPIGRNAAIAVADAMQAASPADTLEPVAYLRWWARQINEGHGNIGHEEGFEVCEAHEASDDGTPAFPVYVTQAAPSPQIAEKVELPLSVDAALFAWGRAIKTDNTDAKIAARKALIAAIRQTREDAIAAQPAEGAGQAGQVACDSEVLRALRDSIPLQEPVYIGKALRAQREARVSLSGGTGPVACAMLVNIQLTGWADGPATAEAFVKGYNRALKDYRHALLEVATERAAAPASGDISQSAPTSTPTSAPVAHSVQSEKAAAANTGKLLDAAEALLEVLDGYHEQLVPINRKSTTVTWLRNAVAEADRAAAKGAGVQS